MLFAVFRNDFHELLLRMTADLSVFINAKAEEQKETLLDCVAAPYLFRAIQR